MTITVYLATSVNGMISNKSNIPDWLSSEYSAVFMELCERAKAVIMGRKTYNILAPDYLPLKNEGTLVVLTHDTAPEQTQSNVVFTADSPQRIVSTLEGQGFAEAVIIGGTATVSAFTKARVVTDVILVVEPVLFGAGLPLLRDVDDEFRMALQEVKKLNDDTVRLHYRVTA